MHAAPNAALLIDFDNVTMGIRSDLGKELKALLNSDVIRGKVAVQRAYADWRRYPQYIVPLAESSIDLIFAPAYGSSKKNATDLRMAIDAMELVFTRPEIGTFILLTGDSDFSSCVLKLKEYGKYVIGVGMRESSSDLLIQNCDEYYSYHALSGLTRAGEVVESKEDPWVLVRTAVAQMVREHDVMRTDRLKQVMIGLDHAFDEKKLGYSKFSKFVQEAEKKGLLQLRRGENGQQEIVPTAEAGAPAAEPTRAAPVEAERERERRGNGRHRRGGRGAPRGEAPREVTPKEAARPEPQPIAPPAEAAVEAAPETVEVPAVPAAAAEVPAAPPAAPVEVAPAVSEVTPETAPVAALQTAYALVQQALSSLGGTARDAELKRKMLEISPAFDEGAFGFAKFTRFLRQAHDAEVVDLNRVGEGSYEVALGSRRVSAPVVEAGAPAAPAKRGGRGRGGRGREARAVAAEAPAAPITPTEAPAAPEAAAPVAEVAPAPAPTPAPPPSAPAAEVKAPAGRRGMRGGRGAVAGGPPPLLPGQVIQPPSAVQMPETEAPAAQPAPAVAAPEAPVAEAPIQEAPIQEAPIQEAPAAAPKAKAPAAEAAPTAETAAAPAAEPSKRSVRGRRGGRGRGAAAGEAPTLLPGQVVSVETTPALPAAEEPEAAAPAPVEAEAPGVEAPAEVAEKPAKAAKKSRGSRGRGKRAEAAPTPEAEPEVPAAPRFDAAALGLPSEPEAMRTYLATAYKGVGQKTADTLMTDFGEDAFRVLQEEPERVRALLGDRRAGQLLENWTVDYARRAAEVKQPEAPAAAAKAAKQNAAKPKVPKPEAAEGEAAESEAEEAPRAKSRTRRGGRGRRKKKDTPAS